MIVVNLENFKVFFCFVLFLSAFLTRWSVPENPKTYELSSTFYKILLPTRLTEDGGIPQIPK